MGAHKGECVPVGDGQRFDGVFELGLVLVDRSCVELLERGEWDQRLLKMVIFLKLTNGFWSPTNPQIS